MCLTLIDCDRPAEFEREKYSIFEFVMEFSSTGIGCEFYAGIGASNIWILKT